MKVPTTEQALALAERLEKLADRYRVHADPAFIWVECREAAALLRAQADEIEALTKDRDEARDLYMETEEHRSRALGEVDKAEAEVELSRSTSSTVRPSARAMLAGDSVAVMTVRL